MKTVYLLDYGVGNVGSLTAMLERLGYIGVLTSEAAVVRSGELLLLPGVGSSSTAMRELEARRLIEPLKERHGARRPFVGICLGAQLLFSRLDEAQRSGLGFLHGTVAAFDGPMRFNTGWCQIDWPALKATGFATGLRASDTFFFNHQYALPWVNEAAVVALAGRPDVPALYVAGHLCGIQFHPEKSQSHGRRLIKNILAHYLDL